MIANFDHGQSSGSSVTVVAQCNQGQSASAILGYTEGNGAFVAGSGMNVFSGVLIQILT